ncbi:MAG: 6-phosphogluconolactonase [Herpetosiphonaceae bacterium]|nr:6-phosphogluconolactonase [Herpetosiphonaceae bacterium]
MKPDVEVLDDAAILAQTAAQLIVDRAKASSERFTLVLSGGSTPKAIYRLLAQPPLRDEIPWPQVQLFWGDERSVPPDHADSNFRTAREELIDHVPIPAANIHRIQAELPASEAATAYEAELQRFFGSAALPRFDLVLLGMGDEGHTASLFPNTTALDETQHWVVANYVPKLHTARITLTFPVINNAQEVVFLVAGAAKQEALGHVLYGQHDHTPLPAARIAPTNGRLLWLLDRSAMPVINH